MNATLDDGFKITPLVVGTVSLTAGEGDEIKVVMTATTGSQIDCVISAVQLERWVRRQLREQVFG